MNLRLNVKFQITESTTLIRYAGHQGSQPVQSQSIPSETSWITPAEIEKPVNLRISINCCMPLFFCGCSAGCPVVISEACSGFSVSGDRELSAVSSLFNSSIPLILSQNILPCKRGKRKILRNFNLPVRLLDFFFSVW